MIESKPTRLKYYIILFSIIGICLLYGCAQLAKPQQINLDSIAEFEGKQVIVEGRICRHYTTSYGDQFLTIQSINASQSNVTVLVFTEYPITIEYGDIIQATGTVQRYQNEWEITTQTEKDITLVSKWNNETYPFWQLAENPQRYTGLNVKIKGHIDRAYDTYFYLIDDNEEYCLLVSADYKHQQNVTQGNQVTVCGFFIYDTENMRYALDITNDAHGVFLYEEDEA